jgi:hypothetical protein
MHRSLVQVRREHIGDQYFTRVSGAFFWPVGFCEIADERRLSAAALLFSRSSADFSRSVPDDPLGRAVLALFEPEPRRFSWAGHGALTITADAAIICSIAAFVVR